MADQATLELRLADLEEAMHQFALGEMVAKITRENGDEITFRATNMGLLRREIQSIKRQLGQTPGVRIKV